MSAEQDPDILLPRVTDPRAEQALLAACLYSKTARQAARRQVNGSDFYLPEHEVLWDVMALLDRAGATVDAVTMHAALVKRFPGCNVARSTEAAQLRRCADALIRITTDQQASADGAVEYAQIVHGWSLRRRLGSMGRRIIQEAENAADPSAVASQAVTWLTSIRDQGAPDMTALSLAELMDVPDDSPEWVIPDLLERGDRVIFTGDEGVGKSAFLRQLAILPAAGLHPFTEAVMPPIRSLIVDAENKPTQVRRQARPMIDWLARSGADDPTSRVLFDCVNRIDITKDRGLSRIHQTIDAFRPDLVVLGPIYRMVPRALNTDDEAAAFLSAIDTITERGCAVILEAHAGHTKDDVGTRNAKRALRPRGSAALIGWPEFGLGLRGLPHGLADLEPWRGGRESRPWPSRMRRAAGNRWVEVRPDDRGPYTEEPPPPAPEVVGDALWG